jgi:general secretion pathway protein M
MSTGNVLSELRRSWATAAALWRQRPVRERVGVGLALGLLVAALVWTLLLAPALQLWRSAPQKEAAALQRLERIQALAAEHDALQRLPRLPRATTVERLRVALAQSVGTSGRIEVQGDRAVVTLSEAPADGLARLLTQARERAHVLPVQAKLERAATPGLARWSGTLGFALSEE